MNKKTFEYSMQDYRDVFLATDKGRKVFAHMLCELGMGKTSLEAADIERIDYAHRLLQLCGVFAMEGSGFDAHAGQMKKFVDRIVDVEKFTIKEQSGDNNE